MELNPQQLSKYAWHTLNVNDTLKLLQSSNTGLTDAEVDNRKVQFGPNHITEKSAIHWYKILTRQFTDFLILILIIAAIISLLVGEVTNAIAIICIVILNGILGFIQEYKAETALQQLHKILTHHCKVIRNNQAQNLDTKCLVPGDIVILEVGNQVGADLRLIEATNLMIDEAILTGESTPVLKDTLPVTENTPLAEQNCIARMGTIVTYGRAIGVVIATGSQTEFGRIASLTSKIKPTITNLQKKLANLAKKLAIMALIICIGIVTIGIIKDKSIFQMFMAGIALAVAAVPEGLPAVVTITLALGVRTMVRRKALLRNLQAAEGLGATSVICIDKTGTLTKNEMTLKSIWLPGKKYEIEGVGYDPKGDFILNNKIINPKDDLQLITLLKTGLICNHAFINKEEDNYVAIGSPTEASLIVAAQKAGIQDIKPNIILEYSFDSNRKCMSVITQKDDHYTVHTKGAPEVLLKICNFILDKGKIEPLSDHYRSEIHQAYLALAKNGQRTLALATKTFSDPDLLSQPSAESELVFLGLVGIIDPPRSEAKNAVETAKSAGIKIIMMTGDSPETATAIAKQIGLTPDNTITGQQIDNMSDEELLQQCEQKIIFARTVPEHKLRIVKLLQSQHQTVAMTGDGINDAPALKQADVGIAMGIRGTDVAKGASDMVLLDDNFASIVSAIEEGRRQYANIQKFVRYLLSSNLGEVFAIFINILIGGPLILLPAQILWINLVTDGVTAVTLGLAKAEKNIMQYPPRKLNQPILDKGGMLMVFLLGCYIAAITLYLFHSALNTNPENLLIANTMAFTGIVILEKANVFNFQTLQAPTTLKIFFGNPWLLIAIMFTICLQIAAVYVPFLQTALGTTALNPQQWGILIAFAIPLFIMVEVYKRIRSKFNPKGA